jgi:hypothetical protein
VAQTTLLPAGIRKDKTRPGNNEYYFRHTLWISQKRVPCKKVLWNFHSPAQKFVAGSEAPGHRLMRKVRLEGDPSSELHRTRPVRLRIQHAP